MAWIFSHGKPMRSSTPGPKFSTSTSQLLISAVRTSLPFGFFMSSVIERLLWLSMVKYRLSTLGMSCNWPRVISPTPGRSTLITSAPNHASNCVQVGPDWTWVKSRMRTPLSAFVIVLLRIVSAPAPAGRKRGGAARGPAPDVANLFPAKHALRVEVADAAALGAGRRVDHRVDQCRLAGVHGLVHGALKLVRCRRVDANAAEGLHHLVVTRVLDEDGRRNVRTARRIDVGSAIDAVIIEDDDADRQVVPADRLDLHARETKGAIAFHREHVLAGLDGSCDRKAHADAHDAPGADVQAFARLVHVDDAAREIARVGAFVDQDGIRTLLDDGLQRTERAVVVHGRLVVHQPWRHLGDVFFPLRIDGADPVSRRGGPVAAHRFKQGGYAGADVADHGSCDLDI